GLRGPTRWSAPSPRRKVVVARPNRPPAPVAGTARANVYAYDVFLSHSSKNKDAVGSLAERLKADGLRVWFDEWEIQPGDPIFQKVQEGLQRSRILLLFLSRHSLDSDWAALEHQTILFRDPTNKDRRFIPLRLDDAEPPDILRHFAYIDWRKK